MDRQADKMTALNFHHENKLKQLKLVMQYTEIWGKFIRPYLLVFVKVAESSNSYSKDCEAVIDEENRISL
jgi:hypothetical protein